jgi:tetratricopeptide (TPR) repeat protein
VTIPTSRPVLSFADGRYQVRRVLGEGGKKRVYLAHDSRLARDVAIAVLKTEGLDDAGLTRIRHEANAMGRLGQHSHIVTVYDVADEQGHPFIVSEYVPGGDIERRIREAPDCRLPVDQALGISAEVCAALAYAHAQGIIHRDLKPGNVYLTNEGAVKLGDFGLAVATDRSRITQEGTMVGTAAYMAPEQALGGEVTVRSDLYSLGAMLYAMLTGRPPFIGNDAVSIISQHLNAQPITPCWHNPEIGPDVESLVLELLEKNPEKRPQSAAAVRDRILKICAAPAPPAPARERPARGSGRLVWGRFVGRAAELDRLKEALDGALGGCGSLFMLVGEPGIGKTRLAEETSTYARLRGARVLFGRCLEGEASVPYLSFVEALRQYVADCPDEVLKQELGTGAGDVARLVSEVRQRIPDLPELAATDPEQERYRLFESVVTFLLNAARARPLLLILDDLHWADRPSLLLLQHLARRLAGSRILVIGTYRDVELDRRHPFASVLADLRRERIFERVLLRGLSRDEVHALLEALAQHELDSMSMTFAEALQRETEGNPFFIEEVIRHLLETGALYRREGRWVSRTQSIEDMGIPEGVREVIGRRLSRLSSTCNQALAGAAVLGREFDFGVLQRMSGFSDEELVTAIEQALEAQLVIEVPGRGDARYAFTHALVRETLYEELSLPRKQRLHLKVAQAIEASYARNLSPHLAALAVHYRLAGAAAEAEKTIDYSVRAGESATSVLAWEEAIEHWSAALELMREEGVDQRRQAALLERLGDLRYVSGFDWERGVEYLEEALSIYESLGEKVEEAKIHSRLGRDLCTYPSQSDIPRSMAHFAAAESILRPYGDSAALALVYSGIGFAAYQGLRIEEGIAAASRAIEIAEKLGNEAVHANAAFILGTNLAASGRLGEGIALVERAWATADRLNLEVVAYFATSGRGMTAFSLHDPREAQSWVEKELARRRVAQAPIQRRTLTFQRAMAAARLGNLAEARTMLEFDWGALGPLGESLEPEIMMASGDWEMAKTKLEEQVERYRKAALLGAGAVAIRRLAALHSLLDDPARAASLLQEAVQVATGGGGVIAEVLNRADLARVLAQLGRSEDAEPELGRCQEVLAAGEEWRGLAGRVALAAAAVAASRGLFEVASPEFQKAVEIARHYGGPWDEADALHLWGCALLDCGDRRQAVERLDASLAIYQRIGAGSRWLERVLADKLRVEKTPATIAKSSNDADAASIEARQVASGRNLFRREGDYWTIGYDAKAFRLRDTKGLRYLAELLRSPGRELDVLDLAAGGSSAGTPAAVDLGDAGEGLDAQAKADYRRRLDDLRAELEEAESFNDPERALRAREEIEFLTEELARATGLGGRDRKTGSSAERARLNVTMAVKAALRKISENCPGLGRHLAATVKTGRFCSYTPDPHALISWTF